MKKEIVDIRYVAKILFLILSSFNLGHTFEVVWLGLVFAVYFVVVGVVNATSRREFSKRPKYSKIPAYGAIVPLALYWVMTPGVESGVNPTMVFLPGLYLLFLAALQERSRGHGGFESFVAFDGIAALLFGMFLVPRGWAGTGFAGLLLALFAYSRRGTAWYKYLLFGVLIVVLSGISYGGWRYWRTHRYEYGSRMADDYYQRERVMGFGNVAALGSFRSNYLSKYNNQVVLRVWDSLPSKYMKAASYEKYVAGIWKPPIKPAKTLVPAYYQVDYAVLEVGDSLTKSEESRDARRSVRQVWVQSTLDNFGFAFAPYGAVGFAAKDVDSLHYFSGGMVNGLNKNGKRSDWYYFACDKTGALGNCEIPDSLLAYTDGDLLVGKRYEPLIDSVVEIMGLENVDSGQVKNLERMLAYFKDEFTYALQIPGLERYRGASADASKDPLSVFWHAKQGFCEYYATLATLALRRVGIPARYVTGFANPEVVVGRPYAVFRRRSSHSWVEAFVDGRWVIFDPTPPMLTPMGSELGWLNAKWEGLSGRMARIMHFLKEGEWRRTVDSWQNYTQKIADGVAIYVLLVIAVVAFAVLKLRSILRGRKSSVISPKTTAALEWARKLSGAEKFFARVGLHRAPGETVGRFEIRVEQFVENILQNAPAEKLKAAKVDSLKRNLQVLQDYEKNRWA